MYAAVGILNHIGVYPLMLGVAENVNRESLEEVDNLLLILLDFVIICNVIYKFERSRTEPDVSRIILRVYDNYRLGIFLLINPSVFLLSFLLQAQPSLPFLELAFVECFAFPVFAC